MQDPSVGEIFWFFFKAGAFVFGSGLAIVPFLYGGVVTEYGWLDSQEFLDAVAVAMITPRPGGHNHSIHRIPRSRHARSDPRRSRHLPPGNLLTVLPAPYSQIWESSGPWPPSSTASPQPQIGTIAGAVIVLGRRAIYDIPTALIALSALLIRGKSPRRIPEPVIIAGAAILGLVIFPMVSG